jgi:hypothetical protein
MPALGPTQTSIQWLPGGSSPGVKWLERETDRSPSNTEAMNVWIYTSSALYAFMAFVATIYLMHGDAPVKNCTSLQTSNYNGKLSVNSVLLLRCCVVEKYQCFFVEEEGSSPCSKKHSYWFYPKLVRSSPPVDWHLNCMRSILILFPHVHHVLQGALDSPTDIIYTSRISPVTVELPNIVRFLGAFG